MKDGKKTDAHGKGLIDHGADRFGYMGHFRNAEVMKRGHNQGGPGVNQGAMGANTQPSQGLASLLPANQAGAGAKMPAGGGMPAPKPLAPANQPGGGTPSSSQAGAAAPKPTPLPPPSSPLANPVSNPAGFAAAGGASHPAISGKPTYDVTKNPVLATKQALRGSNAPAGERRAEMKAARTARAGIPQAERRGSAQEARAGTPGGMRKSAVGEARGALSAAIGGVRQARQGLAGAIRGGDVSGAGKAATGLKAAKSARRTARKEVGAARRAKY
jgi:hypothetical protein